MKEVDLSNVANKIYDDVKNPRRKILDGTSRENKFGPTKTSLSLTDLLPEEQGQGILKRRLEKLQNGSVSNIRPLETRPETARSERKVGYENASKRVENWEQVVLSNRKSKLSFPLNEKSTIERPSIKNIAEKAHLQKPRTQLEIEIAEALKSSGLANESDIQAKETQDLLKIVLTEEEASKRKGELAKKRALLFYQEQKAKRIKKIKSKTFRKLRKKKLNREEEKALEELRASNPEMAKEYDEKLALDRARERMSLKHKNTSKNMRELSKRVKFENDELRNKVKSIKNGSDDDSGEDSSEEDDEKNEKEFEKVESGVKSLLSLKFMQRALEKERIEAEQGGEAVNNSDTLKVGKISFKKPQQDDHKPLFEQPEFSNKEDETETSGKTKTSKNNEDEDNPWLAPQVSLRNRTKIVSEGIKMNQVLENISQKAEAESDDEDIERSELVKQAFADIVEQDFMEEKEKEENAVEPEDTALPGWGSWVGPGVKAKKPKILKKTPTAIPDKPHVIFSSKTNKLQKKYQVEKVPYPFTSREQYERSLKDPLGPEWNSNKRFEDKVQPDVVTKSGTIIQQIKFPKMVQNKPKKKNNRKGLS